MGWKPQSDILLWSYVYDVQATETAKHELAFHLTIVDNIIAEQLPKAATCEAQQPPQE